MGNGFFSQLTSRGYRLGEVVSALQKACRRGQEAEATWWAAELDRSGHCRILWQRLETIVVEDVGPTWPEGVLVIRQLKARWEEELKLNKGDHGERCYPQLATMLLARWPKTRRLTHAIHANYADGRRRFAIPDEALDQHTARGRAKGRGKDHFESEGALLANEADLGHDPYREFYLELYDTGDDEFNVAVDPRAQRPQPGGEQGTIW